MRQEYSNTNVSAYANLNGTHNYSAKPCVPLWMESTNHKKPNHWQMFAPRCVKVYVLGTSPKHYRCWQLWVKETCTPRISGRVFFKHKYITNRISTPEYSIMAAAANLTSSLEGKMPPHLQESYIQALERLQDILNQTAPPPPPTHSTSNPAPRR